jgi:predicted SnoaL-like aldol condensation-catalyzing enzyme
LRTDQQLFLTRGSRINTKLLAGVATAALWTAFVAPAYSADEGAANLQLAKNWVRDIGAVKGPTEARAVVERYMSPDYVQHSSGFPPGRAGVIEVLTKASAAGTPLKLPGLVHRSFVANKDFVMWIDEVEDSTKPGEHSFAFEIFRVRDGRFTEHWETR